MSVSGLGRTPDPIDLGVADPSAPAAPSAPPAPFAPAVAPGTPTRRPDPAAIFADPSTAPAAPAAPAIAGPEAAYAALRASPHFMRLPDVAREPLAAVVCVSGDAKMVSDLNQLLGAPGFHSRMSPLGKLAVVDVIAREPGSVAALGADLANVRALLGGADYERLCPSDREKINTCLAVHPGASAELLALIALPSFRGLTEDEKQTLCDKIADSPDAKAAAWAAVRDLGGRDQAAAAGLAEVKALLDRLDRPVATGLRGVFGGRDLPGGDDAREAIAKILSGPTGDDVYRALENEGSGVAHSVMKQLIEDPGSAATRARLARVASSLDPSNSAQFISNLSHAIGKEVNKPDLFDAVARGITLRAGVAGAGFDLSGGTATVRADLMRLAATAASAGASAAAEAVAATAASAGGGGASRLSQFLPQVEIGYDPTHIRAYLKETQFASYRNLLTEVLDQVTKSHELTNSPMRWNDDEKTEYFDAIRRLPGGGNASELARDVARPTPPPLIAPQPAPAPAAYYPPPGYPPPGYGYPPPYAPAPGVAPAPLPLPGEPGAPPPGHP